MVGITNEIKLRDKPLVADLTKKLEEALTRQAIREAKRIKVQIEGGTVTLTGTVHSWQERQAAQGVAWSAPGVRVVINELAIE